MANNPPGNQLSGPCLVMHGVDKISELPDSLLTHILSYLPTKLSVKTSSLSKRWKNLWISVPALDLNYIDYEEDQVVLSLFDRLLEFDTSLRLLKVKVKCRSEKIEGLMDRISTVIYRGPQHLEFESCFECRREPDTQFYHYVDFVPLNLYTSKTLVSLKLTYSGVEDHGFVCMPSLKSLTLVEVRFRDDASLEKLVSGCPVLEELTLIRDMNSSFVGEVDRFMRVRSGSLKRFCVPPWHGKYCYSSVKCTLEIEAPGLEHMTLREDHYDSIVVKNLNSLFMVNLDINFSVNFVYMCPMEDLSAIKDIAEFFLSGISSVRHMIISEDTVVALEHYSDAGLLPKFNNLSRLEAVFPCMLLPFLPVFLKRCLNLKHLILKVVDANWAKDEFELTGVPGCFLSTLEWIQLKSIHYWKEEAIKIATYFLQNAAVLKKLTLSFMDYPRLVPDKKIFEEINKVTKLSPTCQILHEWEPGF